MKKIRLTGCCMLLAGALMAQPRDHRSTGSWNLLPATNAMDVTINEKGEIYMVSTAGILYQYTGTGWTENDNSKLRTYAEYGSIKLKVYSNGLMSKNFTGVNIKTGEHINRWDPISGSDASDLAVTNYIPKGTATPQTKIVMVNTAGKIYQYYDYANKWSQLPGSDGVRIAAGGEEVWLVNTVGKIYRYRKADSHNRIAEGWDQMPGSNGKDISIAHDGTKWLVTTDGKVHRWYGNGWAEQVGVRNAHRIAANNGKVVMINTEGKMYQLAY